VIDPDPDRGAQQGGLNRLLRGRQKEAAGRRPRDEEGEEEVEGRAQADFSDNVGLTVLMPGGTEPF
jgi:hypothetical protein